MNSPARGLFLIALILALSGLCLGSFAQTPVRGHHPVFYSGERLQYKVSWLFFRLGTVVVTTEKIPGPSLDEQYRVRIHVESNPALFFVSVHSEYESIVSASSVRPLSFTARELSGSDTVVTRYVMNDTLHQVHVDQWHEPGHTEVKQQILDSVDVFYEGASMFFFARSRIHSGTSVTIPTLVEFNFFKTDISFTKQLSGVSIDALENEIETKELYGFAHFVGSSIGGFSGEFRGWFTNDEAAIPVLAEMNLTLGTADVELEQWSRGSWSPPLFRGKK